MTHSSESWNLLGASFATFGFAVRMGGGGLELDPWDGLLPKKKGALLHQFEKHSTNWGSTCVCDFKDSLVLSLR